MMDIILGIKDGVAAEYTRYKRADKNPTFRKELIDEVSQLSEEQRMDIEHCTDLLEALLRVSNLAPTGAAKSASTTVELDNVADQ